MALFYYFLLPLQVWQAKKEDIRASSKSSMAKLAEVLAPEVGAYRASCGVAVCVAVLACCRWPVGFPPACLPGCLLLFGS